jgi:hypothetical protein
MSVSVCSEDALCPRMIVEYTRNFPSELSCRICIEEIRFKVLSPLEHNRLKLSRPTLSVLETGLESGARLRT